MEVLHSKKDRLANELKEIVVLTGHSEYKDIELSRIEVSDGSSWDDLREVVKKLV